MSTKINLTYCGMDGSGATVREAKQDAARKIESALAGSYAPFVIRHAGMVGIIWREPTGYAYKIDRGDTFGRLYGSSGMWDELGTKRACARHMAQNANTYAGIESILTDADRRELDSYFDWQSRYAFAKARGDGDDAARQYADKR